MQISTFKSKIYSARDDLANRREPPAEFRPATMSRTGAVLDVLDHFTPHHDWKPDTSMEQVQKDLRSSAFSHIKDAGLRLGGAAGCALALGGAANFLGSHVASGQTGALGVAGCLALGAASLAILCAFKPHKALSSGATTLSVLPAIREWSKPPER